MHDHILTSLRLGSCRLRLVEERDAEFLWGLRVDPTISRYLSTVTGDSQQQLNWIRTYKERERSEKEFYFIIMNETTNTDCGCVRVYNISEDSFTWGSWILTSDKPAKGALSSACLVYKFAFEGLRLKTAKFDVMKGNVHTIAFHRRFGATEIGEDDTNVYFSLSAEDFQHLLVRHASNFLSA